jgi:hypothetical protein
MDPRESTPDRRPNALSRLMLAKGRTGTGEKVNFCPFGCATDELDEHGYCKHLVGFTADGKTLEPMAADERGRRRVDGGRREPVLKGDVLERITTCSRVYRDEKKADDREKKPAK